MRRPEKAIEELDDQVQRVQTLRHALRLTPDSLYVVQALGRYLLFAEETGAALARALEENLVFGTHPLLRNLLEGIMELLVMATWPAPGGPSKAAARSMAWDLLQWEKRWGVRKRVQARAPEVVSDLNPEEESEDVDAIFRRHVEEFAELGADTTLFEDAWAEFRQRHPQHWSGVHGFENRAQLVRRRWPANAGGRHVTRERVRQVTYQCTLFWSEGSYGAHASPRWSLVGLRVEDDGSLQPWVREGRSRADQATRQATLGADFLRNMVQLSILLPIEITDGAGI